MTSTEASTEEHRRLLTLLNARITSLADLGRAKDAERWRYFRKWLLANAPRQEIISE